MELIEEMVGGAVGRHRMMQTRTSRVIAKDSGKEEKTPLLHSRCSTVLVCLDITRFVRDGMTTLHRVVAFRVGREWGRAETPALKRGTRTRLFPER
jgi:hypothetical protein